MYKPVETRFWSRVNKTDKCWLWTVSNDTRYGVMSVKGVPTKAHRISWELHNGEIPEGMSVLHTCDNPPCVNPEHLWLGTYGDNIRDAVKKGRLDTRGRAHRNHCVNGHEYKEDNTYVRPNGHRVCNICRRETQKNHYHNQKYGATI